ncbi:MAG: DUF86 domain-containing protein [bacterium]
MKRDDTVYLQHILDAIARIEEYLQGVNEEVFHHRYLIQDGVIRQVEIIGEAVKQLSSELRNQHAHIPWQDIASMRDKLIHHYFGVDIEKVWLTAQEDIPVLKMQVTEILDKTKDSDVGGNS